ncbi:transferase [Trypanosoma rangeli]|uniref:Transferase n=1 Tax=Trypanosoma rangeli TaxID=5698 RepID=A0A3R7LA44_TRYRA|nr:transferase [Trypanosoma rangeli]RNF10151.1 transferase [Trypanosoma rangeli]|eukprot:RNF10151.1 transferase [Trypanosoma rangeli]
MEGVEAANKMHYAAAGQASMMTLERNMRFIQERVPAARINKAQCALVALRLQHIFHTLVRLPDPSPSPQLLTVFASAEMLVQTMGSAGWEALLLRCFTCTAVFTGLFERIKGAWRLHSTVSWTAEHKVAIGEDEVANASIYVQLMQNDGACTATPPTTLSLEGPLENASGLTVKQVIDVFRRRKLGGWKVPFEELISAEGGAGNDAASSRNVHLVFDAHNGYRYKDTAVLLHELEEVDGKRISAEIVMAFVQDMAARATWLHPNIVPFIGAFTEKISTHDGDVPLMSATPTTALGFITEDVTEWTVQAAVDYNPHASAASYVVRPLGSCRGPVAAYHSLHEIMFVHRRRFTLREAVGITLQVADALHYILMDEMQVPFEVAAAWVVVSPSNIFICPIFCADEAGMVTTGPARKWSSPVWGREGAVYDEGMWLTTNTGPFLATREAQEGREVEYVRVPVLGDFAVVYTPPVYVEGGPFSRWQPHPHAASPVSYSLTQLFLALVSNEPPYRLLRRQADLAARIFNAAEYADYNNACTAVDNSAADGLPFVKVSIPIGSVIPAGLPADMRALCQRGLLLHCSHENSNNKGLTLVEFRGSMYAIYESAPDTPCDLTAVSPGRQHSHDRITEPDSRLPHGTEVYSAVEMTSVTPLLDDYGELY